MGLAAVEDEGVGEGERQKDRGKERRGGGFTSIYVAVTRGAREECGRGRERRKRASRSESTILHHWRPFWTTQVAVRA